MPLPVDVNSTPNYTPDDHADHHNTVHALANTFEGETPALLRARSSHTGTQAVSTLSDHTKAVHDALGIAGAAHAASHSDGGTDEIDVVNLGAAGAVNFILERNGGGGLQWIATPHGSALTTKGDIATYDTDDARLGVGTDGQLLSANSSEATGLEWITSSASSPLTTKGDTYTYDTGDQRLGVGTDGQVLTAASGEATGLIWANAATGTIPSGTKVQHALFWDEDTSSAWEAHGFVVNVQVYGADNTGASDSAAAIQAAVDAVTPASANPTGGGVVYFPAGLYRVDTTITVPWGVTLLAYNVDGLPLSGNKATSIGGSFNNNQAQTMIVSNQAIDIITMYHSDNPTSQDWRGASVIGIGFADYSASHDQVDSAIRVRNMNRVIIRDVSVTTLLKTGSAAFFFNPDAAAGDAGQYCQMISCSTEAVFQGVYVEDDVPDITMYDCVLYGPGSNPAANSIGIHHKGSSLIAISCAVQEFDTLVKIDGAGGGPEGRANRFYGLKLEWPTSQTDGFANAAIWIADSNCDYNLFDGVDAIQTGKAADCARIDAGDNAIFQNCRAGGTDFITTDNGSNTQQYGYMDNPVHATGVNLTVTGVHRFIRITNGTITLTLPDAADRVGLPLYVWNDTGGTPDIATVSSQQINNAASPYTMTANQLTLMMSDGVQWSAIGESTPGSQILWLTTPGDLSVGTGTFKYIFPIAAEILGVTPILDSGPTGSSAIFDIHLLNTSDADQGTMWSTAGDRPTIAAGATRDSPAETAPTDNATLAAGESIRGDIDQIGSTLPGTDLVVAVRWRPV